MTKTIAIIYLYIVGCIMAKSMLDEVLTKEKHGKFLYIWSICIWPIGALVLITVRKLEK